MFYRVKRPNIWIGMVSSCICAILWGAILVWYAVDGKNIVFPLFITGLFSLCALSEIKLYMKALKKQKGRNERDQESKKGSLQ